MLVVDSPRITITSIDFTITSIVTAHVYPAKTAASDRSHLISPVPLRAIAFFVVTTISRPRPLSHPFSCLSPVAYHLFFAARR